MKITILTTFPEMFTPLHTSMLGRAEKAGILDIREVDIRAYSKNKHHNTDDAPFGGGAGMVMLAQPIVDAIRDVQGGRKVKRIYLSPRGETLTQKKAEQLAKEDELILLCGHYEGVDQRALDLCIDEEISIGDYVLTGGELGAMVLLVVSEQHRQPLLVFLPGEHLNDVLIAPHAPAVNLSPRAQIAHEHMLPVHRLHKPRGEPLRVFRVGVDGSQRALRRQNPEQVNHISVRHRFFYSLAPARREPLGLSIIAKEQSLPPAC